MVISTNIAETSLTLEVLAPLSEREVLDIFSAAVHWQCPILFKINALFYPFMQGVVYVVDSGFSKQRFYNPVSYISFILCIP